MKIQSIEHALEVFEKDIHMAKQYGLHKDILQKKIHAYNFILLYINNIEMDVANYQAEISKLNLIIHKMAGILLSMGIKCRYVDYIPTMPVQQIQYMVDKAHDYNMFNRFVPDDFQLQWWLLHISPKVDEVLNDLIADRKKMNPEILEFLEKSI
jgi:hypothetical protein